MPGTWPRPAHVVRDIAATDERMAAVAADMHMTVILTRAIIEESREALRAADRRLRGKAE